MIISAIKVTAVVELSLMGGFAFLVDFANHIHKISKSPTRKATMKYITAREVVGKNCTRGVSGQTTWMIQPPKKINKPIPDARYKM